ncbi:MAG: hypothetical protein ACR2GK_03100 [Gemmatimonadaceae bacterium]
MPKTLSANDLRWLGEEADGRRGESFGLVWENDKLVFVPADDPRASKAVLTVRTEYEVGPGLQASEARIKVVVGEEVIDPNKGPDPVDAVFLTQAAVEKFVIPYYTRMLELEQIEGIKRRLFEDARVVAAAHIRPSIIDEVRSAKLVPIALSESGELTLLDAVHLY